MELKQAAEPLRWFYEMRGRFREGVEIFSQAVAGLNEADPSHHGALAVVLLGCAWHSFRIGRVEQARQAAERGLALLRPLGDRKGILEGLFTLGHIAWHAGDYALANRYYEEALALAREDHDLVGTAESLESLGWVETLRGNYPQAKPSLQEALSLYQRLGKLDSVVTNLNSLGYLMLRTGNPQEARPLFKQGLQLAREIGFQAMIPHLLNGLGLASYELGEYGQAQTFCTEALELARQNDDPAAQLWALLILGKVATVHADYGPAQDALVESLKLAWFAGQMQEVLRSLVALAELRAKEGHKEQAARLLGTALAHPALGLYSKTCTDRLLKELRGNLPAKAMAAALADGKTVPVEEAVEGLLRQSPPDLLPAL